MDVYWDENDIRSNRTIFENGKNQIFVWMVKRSEKGGSD